MPKTSLAPKNVIRYTFAASVTIATLLGAQRLAFNERSVDDTQVDVLLPSVTAVVPTIQAPATMATSTVPPTNTPNKVPATVTESSNAQVKVSATATTLQPTNTPSSTATAMATQMPTAKLLPTRVVVAPQQPRPQSHSSKP